jgi:hypothetical protein
MFRRRDAISKLASALSVCWPITDANAPGLRARYRRDISAMNYSSKG